MINFVGFYDKSAATTFEVPYTVMDADGAAEAPTGTHTADLFDEEFGTAIQTGLTPTAVGTAGTMYTVTVTSSWLTVGKVYTIVATKDTGGTNYYYAVTFMAV